VFLKKTHVHNCAAVCYHLNVAERERSERGEEKMTVFTTSLEMLLDGLNDLQREAVTVPDRHVVVFAGPGSGKTTVLTRRVLHALHTGTPAERLMVVTFTRAAAREMKERLEQVMGDRVKRLFIGTFHSLFLSLLKESGVTIPPLMTEGEQAKRIRSILMEENLPSDEETVSTTLLQIGLCKNNLILPERMKVEKKKNILFHKVFMAYEKGKRESGVWDYDDILLAMHRVLSDPETAERFAARFDQVLVDEFQDINRVQYEVVRRLVRPHGRLFAVGDDDQAIYGFRGSDPRFMLELEKDFPGIRKVVLLINYRSTNEIIRLSDRLIRHNRMREPKPREGINARGPEAEWLTPEDEEHEAELILSRLRDGLETAVLYRTSTQARALIDALVRKGISFFTFSGESSFYRRWQVQDVLAYLRLAYDPNDLDALVRIINRPKRYLSGEDWLDAAWSLARKTGRTVLDVLPEIPGLEAYHVRYLSELQSRVKELLHLSAAQAVRAIRGGIGYDRWLDAFASETGNDRSTVFEPVEELVLAAEPFADGKALLEHAGRVEAALECPDRSSPIKLMTLHKSKGLEFDRVFLIGLHAMVIPHHRALMVPEHRKAAAWEEERRLLYVGITRAKTELVLSASKTRQGKRVGISPFVKELGFGVEKADPVVTVQADNAKPGARLAAAPVLKSEGARGRFAEEPVAPGMRILHVKYGEGTVIQITPLEGVAPGRKVLVRFEEETHALHYELSRQLGLVSPKN
jgi:DNA helicase-2/ATP-dependent DNA helicase PcrA